MLWIVWGLAGPMLRDFITEMHYRRHGEKSPRTLREETRNEAIAALRANLMSIEEVKARARAYIRSLGRSDDPTISEPQNVELCFLEDDQRKPGDPLGKFYYSMQIGSALMPPVLQMDAINGTVVRYKAFPR